MMFVLAAIGWGLFGAGALTHGLHRDRLTNLLTLHVGDRAGLLSAAVVMIEVAITLAVIVGVLVGSDALVFVAAGAGAVLGVAFSLWVGRLLATDSSLPCACSFSSAPTSGWSLVRSAATVLIGLFLVSGALPTLDGTTSTAAGVAALIVGGAVGFALFVFPDAVAWPTYVSDMKARAATQPPVMVRPETGRLQ